MRPCRLLRLLSDFDYKIRYHPGKASVAADALANEWTLEPLSTIRNTPLEIGKYGHGFYHKTTKDNKQLRHELGNRDHQKNYANMRCKPLEFKIGDNALLKVSPWKISDTF
ncbi:hypothetical protein Tco_0013756 [Tanacetum coccineum]